MPVYTFRCASCGRDAWIACRPAERALERACDECARAAQAPMFAPEAANIIQNVRVTGGTTGLRVRTGATIIRGLSVVGAQTAVEVEVGAKIVSASNVYHRPGRLQ